MASYGKYNQEILSEERKLYEDFLKGALPPKDLFQSKTKANSATQLQQEDEKATIIPAYQLSLAKKVLFCYMIVAALIGAIVIAVEATSVGMGGGSIVLNPFTPPKSGEFADEEKNTGSSSGSSGGNGGEEDEEDTGRIITNVPKTQKKRSQKRGTGDTEKVLKKKKTGEESVDDSEEKTKSKLIPAKRSKDSSDGQVSLTKKTKIIKKTKKRTDESDDAPSSTKRIVKKTDDSDDSKPSIKTTTAKKKGAGDSDDSSTKTKVKKVSGDSDDSQTQPTTFTKKESRDSDDKPPKKPAKGKKNEAKKPGKKSKAKPGKKRKAKPARKTEKEDSDDSAEKVAPPVEVQSEDDSETFSSNRKLSKKSPHPKQTSTVNPQSTSSPNTKLKKNPNLVRSSTSSDKYEIKSKTENEDGKDNDESEDVLPAVVKKLKPDLVGTDAPSKESKAKMKTKKKVSGDSADSDSVLPGEVKKLLPKSIDNSASCDKSTVKLKSKCGKPILKTLNRKLVGSVALVKGVRKRRLTEEKIVTEKSLPSKLGLHWGNDADQTKKFNASKFKLKPTPSKSIPKEMIANSYKKVGTQWSTKLLFGRRKLQSFFTRIFYKKTWINSSKGVELITNAPFQRKLYSAVRSKLKVTDNNSKNFGSSTVNANVLTEEEITTDKYQIFFLAISLWGTFVVICMHVMFRSFRTFSIPFVTSVSYVQFGYCTVSILILSHWRGDSDATVHSCLPYVSFLSFFNIAQIFFICAIAINLNGSVRSYEDALLGTKMASRRFILIMIGVWMISLSGSALNSITYFTSSGIIERSASSGSICLLKWNAILNYVVLPIGAFTVNVIIFAKFRKVIGVAYPTSVKGRLNNVTHAYLAAFSVCWGSMIIHTLLDEYFSCPGIISVIFECVFYSQGFIIAMITISKFYFFRKAYDYGLSLKAIAPCSIVFSKPLEVLGEGTYATVVKAKWRHGDGSKMNGYKDKFMDVAVKIFKSNLEGFVDKYREEAYLASKLSHPNVLCTYGCYSVETSICIVTEYLSGGTLQSLIDSSHGNMTYIQVVKYALMIADGMNFLHSLAIPVIHRDLKPLNILIDSNGVLKIADFGASRKFTKSSRGQEIKDCHPVENLSREMTGYIGSPIWTAPEMMKDDGVITYSLKADVYSFGIICWQLFTGSEPFKDVPGSLLALEEAVIDGKRPPVPQNCPVFFKKVMTYCWDSDPEQRPSFHHLVMLLKVEQEYELKKSRVTLSRLKSKEVSL